MDLNKLKDKFHPDDIEWRIQSSGVKDGKPWGLCLAYVTNRAIMERLDDVCGVENWKNEYKSGVDGGVICRLSIRINDEWITKEDGAENTQIESVKGGLSGSMKRAAVQWGIGRYLYNLSATFANFTKDGRYSAKIKEDKNDKYGKWFKWNPPQLPSWAIPEGVDNVDYKALAYQYGKELKEICGTDFMDIYRKHYENGSYKVCIELYNQNIGSE